MRSLTLLLFFFLLLKETRCSHLKLYEFQRKLQQKNTLNVAAGAATKSNGRVFYPIGYGADPTGAQDSSASIMEILSDAVKLGKGLDLLPGITDLGGVIIDLQGGDFTISRPITFPQQIGNIVVKGGSVRASNKFPGNRHLIELGSSPDKDRFSDRKDHNKDGMKYEDITFRDILFDSSYRGGGLLIIASARIRVVDCFFLRFTTQGILVRGGHETFISNSFLGQHPTDGGDQDEKNYSGVGIDIDSTDNAITDVVVFSAATGIVLSGNANIITGVHCYNKAKSLGGVGILVRGAAESRIISPYMDYNSIVIEDPADQVHISNGFFLGGANIVLKSSNHKDGRISGLTIVNNIFSGGTVPCVEIDGVFRSIDQVVIDQNMSKDGMKLRSTHAKRTVKLINNKKGTKWIADFGDILLFPDKINHVTYSFYCKGGIGIGDGIPWHAVTNVSNNVVVIESQQPVNAMVSVSVDQYNMVGEENM